MNDILSTATINEYLTGQAQDMNIEIYPVLHSTNLTLKEMAAAGTQEGTVVIAEEQTMGRGRFGRNFFSPAGTGIYMSILLRPELSPTDSTLITTAAAVAVAEAIEEVTGQTTVIKWINDIWIKKTSACGSEEFAKICGILTEASVSPGREYPDYIILGIGINVFEPTDGFPAELAGIAASAINTGTNSAVNTCSASAMKPELCLPTDTSTVRSRIVASILNKFMEFYPNLKERTFLDKYRRRSVVLGRQINVIENTIRPDIAYSATAIEIDDDCNLIVELPDGTRKALYSGEISIHIQ